MPSEIIREESMVTSVIASGFIVTSRKIGRRENIDAVENALNKRI